MNPPTNPCYGKVIITSRTEDGRFNRQINSTTEEGDRGRTDGASDEEAGVGAEEEGPRRAVVVAREVDHRGVLLPRLQLLAAGGGGGDGFSLQRRLARWRRGHAFRLGLRLRRRHGGAQSTGTGGLGRF
jgi:hypothetical protein